jgi:hypothetical protein
MVPGLSRRLLKRLAQLMVGLVLFTQLVLSAQACMLPQPTPAQAFGDAMAMEQCNDVPMDRTTCLAHCLQHDQASGPSVHFQIDATVPSVAPVVNLSALRQLDFSGRASPVPPCSVGPPLQILFCSFQI